jgi:hypothetical protein
MSTEETPSVKPSWYQHVLTAVGFVIGGFLILGAFLGAVHYSQVLVSPRVTWAGTILILVIAIFTQFYLKRHPLRWVYRGESHNVTRLGKRQILGFLGACLLLWIPRMFPEAKPGTFHELALVSARKNLMILHLRLEEMYATIKAIGTQGAGDKFRSLPDRLMRQADLDLSFCRSFEFHVTDVDPEFLRAANAYCGTVSDFKEVESKAWTIFRQEETQNVLSDADRPEAQLPLACLLDTPETQFYILKFQMVLDSAEKMGMTEKDLLTGSQQIGLPDIPVPHPFIASYVRTKFHIDCETGKILRSDPALPPPAPTNP